MSDLEREEWVSVLSALPESRLSEVVASLPSHWQIRPKTLPQAGLGMLRMRDSAFNESFYLGEFPLASSSIVITTGPGESVEGAALVMDDREERAEQLALCDAVLAHRLTGWQQVHELLLEGLALREQASQERKAMLARTRVDFSLLDDVGEDDA
jgi:alpha-D-ribose 1-methylphosphonate 5-triphosphate synthase subunit PhnG